MCIDSNKRMHIMIKTQLTAMTLAGLLAASGSVFAATSTTGPTDPVEKGSTTEPRTTQGESTMPNTTSTPGTEGQGVDNSSGSKAEGGKTTGSGSTGGSSSGTK
jgi:hypothetical protein